MSGIRVRSLFAVTKVEPRLAFAGSAHPHDVGDRWVTLTALPKTTSEPHGVVRVVLCAQDAELFPLGSLASLELVRPPADPAFLSERT